MASERAMPKISQIATMDRQTLADAILNIDYGFPVDFTPSYLASLSEERLRHILLALCRQSSEGRDETGN